RGGRGVRGDRSGGPHERLPLPEHQHCAAQRAARADPCLGPRGTVERERGSVAADRLLPVQPTAAADRADLTGRSARAPPGGALVYAIGPSTWCPTSYEPTAMQDTVDVQATAFRPP